MRHEVLRHGVARYVLLHLGRVRVGVRGRVGVGVRGRGRGTCSCTMYRYCGVWKQ